MPLVNLLWSVGVRGSVREARHITQRSHLCQLTQRQFTRVPRLSSENGHKYISTTASRFALEHRDQEKVMVRVFEQGKTLPHQQWVGIIYFLGRVYLEILGWCFDATNSML